MYEDVKSYRYKKIYGKGENEIKAVDGITLEIEPHKFSAIIGQSGSGKAHYFTVWQGLINQL